MIAVLASFTLKQRLCKRKYTKAKVFVYVVFWRKRLHTLIKLKNMQKGKWAQSKKNATKMFLIRFHIQYKTDGKMSLDYTTFLNYLLFFFFKWKSNQLWNVCSCDHTHGRTCSGDSTSSPCSRPLAALTAPSRSDERVRNTLDRTTSGVDKQWREKKKKKRFNHQDS